MGESKARGIGAQRLRVGERVQIRSAEEILGTLDEYGCLDALPFMLEMLRFCNQEFTVFKRADKTCDTIEKTGGRRLFSTVHLGSARETAGLRCDGAAHGGCQASCLMFWKEAWLRRVDGNEDPDHEIASMPARVPVMEAMLQRSAVAPEPTAKFPVYRCQATQLRAYSVPLAWWDIRQYVRDVRSGNVCRTKLLRVVVFAAYRWFMKLGIGYGFLLAFYNWLRTRFGGAPWPYQQGALKATPTGELNLQPGELVRIKPLDQILATLDTQNRNRGMRFDPEMVRYCGGTFEVHTRVQRIIDEKTGRMIEFSNPCIILRNVYCLSEYSERRVFCPRSIYSYWREIWLEPVSGK